MFTVLGSTGFIGGELLQALRTENGTEVYAPSREEISDSSEAIFKRNLGHVFYCIGLTANFRSRPLDTVEAHVGLLHRLLKKGQFEGLTYLSSTRVYEGSASTQEESMLQVSPTNAGHLYNISKLMGESLCLSSGVNAKIVRLSNVLGRAMPQQNFISQILNEAVKSGGVHFQTSAQSVKDYVSVSDVVCWLPQIALRGRYRIYNVASGINTSNAELATLLKNRGITPDFVKDAADWSFPIIDTDRLTQEFGHAKHSLVSEFDNLFSYFINPGGN